MSIPRVPRELRECCNGQCVVVDAAVVWYRREWYECSVGLFMQNVTSVPDVVVREGVVLVLLVAVVVIVRIWNLKSNSLIPC